MARPPRPPNTYAETHAMFLLHDLRAALRADAALAWAVANHVGEFDPVPFAWACCTNDVTMNDLISRDAITLIRCEPSCCRDRCRACCDAIRRRAPTPSFDELLLLWRNR